MQGREEVSPVPCLVGNAREAKQVWRNVAHPALQNKQAGPLKCPSLPAGEVHPLTYWVAINGVGQGLKGLLAAIFASRKCLIYWFVLFFF